ncbi:MAG: glycosyltransferase family 2 protein [Planctomycetota bacterium]|jgi:GT2 family glycosyltransferase
MITIIIVNWNGKNLLAECLDGIRRQSFRHFSTILVDNGSNDGSIDFVRQNYPEVRLITLKENLGFAVANNIALRTVQSRYAALLNNDAVPHTLWLEKLAGSLEAHPEAGLAGSKMLFSHNPAIIDRAGDCYTKAGTALLRGRAKPANNFNKPEWIFGACAGAALYRTRMLADIGLFDEDFFLLYEDVDLCFRAQLRGYKCLYVPDAIVYHKAGSSIGDDSPISVYYSHRNLEWVYIQNMPSSLIKKTILNHLVYTIAAFIFFVARGRATDFIRAKWHALKGLKRAIKKRGQIQNSKKVVDEYIWGILENESFLPRLTCRFSKNSNR